MGTGASVSGGRAELHGREGRDRGAPALLLEAFGCGHGWSLGRCVCPRVAGAHVRNKALLLLLGMTPSGPQGPGPVSVTR